MPVPPRSALEAVAVEAGVLALGHFRRVTPERKADRTLVTQADREVEAFVVPRLGALFPEAAITSEEGATRAGNGRWRIVLDPIDGTAAFVAGLPTWCVSIGVLDGGRAVAGVIHVPCAGETYAAVEGVAWWNDVRLPRLSSAPPDGDAFVCVHAKAHLRHRLSYRGKVRSLGSSAYHAALVARGAAEAALLGRVYVWDLAAAAALLDAVGGALRYVSGAPVDLARLETGERAPEDVVAGSPQRLDALLPLLA
jgi:myo-inositol-1(or 4)-monophosphatase